MANKDLSKPVKKLSTSKTITLHHHHSKPYRKRHISLLIFLSFVFIVLFITTIQYGAQIDASINNSINFVSELFSGNKDYTQKIHSTYGFDVSYNQKTFYGSGIDSKSGNLYLGTDLSENRAYSVVRITPTIVNSQTSQSSLTMTYHPEITYKNQQLPTLDSIQGLALTDGLITSSSFVKSTSEDAVIGGQKFLKTIWSLKQSTGLTASIKSEIVSYVAIINGKPFTMVINNGIGSGTNDSLYRPVISSLSFGKSEQAYVLPTQQVVAKVSSQRTLLDTAMFNNLASAVSSSSNTTNSEKLAALYGPAVAKIYNAYCMDISVNGAPFVKNVCNGVMGSGFFVSQNGYLATNGHVATSDPKSAVITFAITAFSKGDSSYLMALLNLTTLSPSDLTGKTDTEAVGLMVNAMYEIPDSEITKTNDVINLLVELNDKSPDITALLSATDARTKYPAQDNIKQASLIASDYRALDGIDGFKASDMAIIKIDGSNYPVTKLGSVSDVSQGSDIYILGYPGEATDNGLVDSTVNTVTLTTGKVSSIKNASGSSKKLIETDTTIGHGNSGGPALSNGGDVVGIATYTVDGSGTGNGVYNYIRDIKDLEDLASKSSITFDTNSKTQSEWSKGLDAFYTAHYSKSLENFKVVKSLYPYNSKVDEFVDKANKAIANGEDVQDFPIVAVIIAAVVVLAGAGVTVFVIIRHKKHHLIYKDQVNQGNIQPMTVASAPQQVVVPMTYQPDVTAPITAPFAAFNPAMNPVPVTQSPPPAVSYFQPVQPVTPTQDMVQPSTPAPVIENSQNGYSQPTDQPPTQNL